MTAEDHYEKFKAFYKSKNYEVALEQVEKAIDLDAQKAKYWQEKANVLWRLKRYKEALDACENTLFLNEDYAEPWYRKGVIHYDLKDYKQALLFHEKAIELDDQYAAPWNSKGATYDALKDYSLALICYEKAIELDDQYAAPWNGKGNLYDTLKDYEQALICYDKAIELDDEESHFLYGKGNVYFALKDYEQALTYYKKAIESDDKNHFYWRGKGIVYHKLKDYKQALVCYEKAIELDIQYADPWNDKGDIYYTLKDYEQALVYYEKAIELDDKNATPWNSKGNLYRDLETHRQALICYEKAIELDVQFASAWNGKGNTYYALKDYEQALMCYRKAIELDAQFASAWNGKGNTYYALKDYEQALMCYRKAIELDVQFASAWNGKGNTYYALKDHEQALVCYKKAVELDDKGASSWSGKGIIYDYLKDYDQAKQCFIRSSFLSDNLIINNLFFFSRYPQAPLYCYELLKDFVHPKNYIEWRNLINLSITQCQPILIYIGYLKLTQKDKQLEEWQWLQWLGIVYYYMGHPIKSYEYLKKVVSIKKEDLLSYYYLILSCRDFAQPEDEYLNIALDIADLIKPKKKRFNFLGKNKIYLEYELQQIYYAGQLWYLDNELKEALVYFESIKSDFLPAAYMRLGLKFHESGEVSNKLAKEIIRAERKVLSTPESFMSGVPEQNINLGLENFRAPIFKYAQYFEIQRGIELLEYEIGDSDFKNFEPIFPDTLKAFWYTWKLSTEQYQQIFEFARKEGIRRRTDDILKSREKVIGFVAAGVDPNKIKNETIIDQEESAKLRMAYTELQKVRSPEILETRIGEMINDWSLPKVTHYRQLTSLFALKGELEDIQKIYLDFFSVLQETVLKKPSAVLLAGEKDLTKTLIGLGIDQLIDDEKPIGQLLDIFLKTFAKGSLAELFATWRKQPNPKFKVYSEFKKDLWNFIGEEQKRLGDDFEKRYPLFGFEEWLR